MFEGFSLEMLISIATMSFSAFQAYNNQRIALEIASLKLWIVANFETKDNADLK